MTLTNEFYPKLTKIIIIIIFLIIYYQFSYEKNRSRLHMFKSLKINLLIYQNEKQNSEGQFGDFGLLLGNVGKNFHGLKERFECFLVMVPVVTDLTVFLIVVIRHVVLGRGRRISYGICNWTVVARLCSTQKRRVILKNDNIV